MLKLVKTTLLSGALLALTAHSAPAQILAPLARCQATGGHIVNGRCEPNQPAEAPPQAGPRAGGPPPQNAQQGQGQGQGQGRGQGNVQGGGQQVGGRGQGQGQQQGNAQQQQQGNGRDNNDRGRDSNDRGRDNNDRNNNRDFGRDNNGRDNRDFGRDNNGRDNRDFGRDNNGRDNRDFGRNDRNFNGGRNFDQAEFNRRYYGRYGNDPNNFERDRLRFRAQARWRERYPHDYVYADDTFYRDCRSNNEVGGAIIGAILGGILGNAASNGQGGGTLAGMILGGVGGAAIASNLDCEDRGYVYRTYYDGFERGRPQASYQWRNDRTGHYGTLLVGDYYRDRDNYRCATYTQTIYVRGRPEVARGHACRQEDGTWAFVD